jgi:hypothetical protein
MLGDWGKKISGEAKKTWKSGKHFVQQVWGDTGDFIDRKIPEFRLDVEAKIDHKIQIDKDNFNVRMDSGDIADAGEKIGTGIGTGLASLGASVGDALGSFGERLSEGLEKLGEQLGQNVQAGLSQLGQDLTIAAAQMTAGITSHGNSIENAVAEFGKIATGISIDASKNLQNGLAILGESIEKIDATGGLGRHLMQVVQHSQAAGFKLLTLDQYFTRITGENVNDTFLLKVENTSARPLAGLEFLANVALLGVGGTAYHKLFLTDQATAGTFKLTVLGATTPALPINSTPKRVQDALAALVPVGAGKVTCTGSPLPAGNIEIVLDGSLGDPAITVAGTGVTPGKPMVQKVPLLDVRTVTAIVSGDPSKGTLLQTEGVNLVRLGSIRREFGVPYVAFVTLELLPSPIQEAIDELVAVLESNTESVNRRRRAAEQLAEAGAFAWKSLADIKDVADNATDPVVKQVAFDAYRAISSFQIDATATVMLSSGDVVEPVSMLRSSLTPGQKLKAKFSLETARPKSRLPMRVATCSSDLPLKSGGVSVKPVNGADLPNQVISDVEETLKATYIVPVQDRAAFKNEPESNQLETAFTMPAITSLQTALDTARDLGKKLRQLTLPNTFLPYYYNQPAKSIYDLARDIVEPTIDQIRYAQTLFPSLTAQLDTRFQTYARNHLEDPALSHLLGIQSLSSADEPSILNVAVEVTDIETATSHTETLVTVLRAAVGEALLPIPLRFVDSKRKQVTVTVSITTGPDISMILTHYTGLVGNFQVVSQTKDKTITFEAQRIVDEA